MEPSERFWSQVDIRGNEDCWYWKGLKNQGYSRFYYQGRNRYAHRVAWQLTNGPIPEGLQVLHSCDTPECVNPGHLHLGTHAENMKEMKEKGRSTQGERSPNSKLTDAQVKEILRIHGEGKLNMKEISRLVGVSYNVVRRIVSRKDWKHVT